MTPPLTIQIVGWNSHAALVQALPALRAIPAAEAQICYIDNASTDPSVAAVRAALPTATIIQNKTNLGFGEAHNLGFRRCLTPFVLTLNPDVRLDWTVLRHLLTLFKNPAVAAVQGKLYRGETQGDQPIIDSTGIVLDRAFNGRERGAGEVDTGQYGTPGEVSAITGACGIYRLSALKKVAHAGEEYFDKDFFAYKEDVDLGWRLRRAGYLVLYTPQVAGTHVRSLRRESPLGWPLSPHGVWQRLRDPRTRLSLRNWVWLIVKNTSLRQQIAHELFIDARLLIFVGASLLYPPLFSVWFEIVAGLPRMIAKRSQSA